MSATLAAAFSLSFRAEAATIYYTYDSVDRVKSVGAGSTLVNYTYDSAGNIIKKDASEATGTSHGVPFLAPGIYQGLAQSPNATLGDSLLKLSVGAGGKFTGALNFHGTIYQLKGAFVAGEDGLFVWNGSIHRTGQPDLIVSLGLDPNDPSGAMTGTLSDDTSSAIISLSRAGFDAKHPTALAGNYTVLLPANPDFPGDPYPQGDGYALLSVTANGVAKLVGKLSDGSTVSQGGALTGDGRFLVFCPLYKGAGVLTGWVDFTPTDEVSDFNGSLEWSKPSVSHDAFYTNGFDFEIDLLGSKFAAPRAGQRILNLQNGENNGVLLLGDGNLIDPLMKLLTLDASSKVRFPVPGLEAPVLSINSKTGLFTGNFLHPQLGKRAKFSGVVFQKQNLASGIFLGQSKNGYVTLQEKATDALRYPPASPQTPGNEGASGASLTDKDKGSSSHMAP